jgi:hypothetical protein
MGDLAAGQPRSELRARLTEEFAVNHRNRRKDRRHEVAKVVSVLEERLGVPEPLQDDALGLVVLK